MQPAKMHLVSISMRTMAIYHLAIFRCADLSEVWPSTRLWNLRCAGVAAVVAPAVRILDMVYATRITLEVSS